MKAADNDQFLMRVTLQDPTILAWYKALPERSKSLEVSRALQRGLATAPDRIEFLEDWLRGVSYKVSDLESINSVLVEQNLRVLDERTNWTMATQQEVAEQLVAMDQRIQALESRLLARANS